MKKYIIFLVNFILLFSLTQILSGMLLTATYTPDISEAWKMSTNLPQEVVFVKSSTIPILIITVLSASLAYLIPNLMKKWPS